MDELILDQAPDLPVQHPVKLGAQEDKVPKMPVRSKEPCPALPAFHRPVPGIKKQLGLIYDQQDRVLFDTPPLKVIPGDSHQTVRLQLMVGDVADVLLSADLYIIHVYREVTKHSLSHPQPVINGPGAV